jgi:hypothetical protein
MQASANIGRSLGGGIASIGQSIGSAIEKYQQNKEERDFLDQKFEMSSSTIDKYKGMPELADDPRLKKLVDGVSKFSAMSNTQKKGFLNNAEFAIAQVDKEVNQKYQREQDQLRNDLARQQALFEGARLGNEATRVQNDTAMTNARIAEMNQQFTPSASIAKLPDGTPVPMVTTSKGTAQVLPQKVAPGPESPMGKLLFDLQQAQGRGDTAGAQAIQNKIDAETNKQPKLEAADQTFIQNIKEYQNQLSSLKDTIKNYGTYESTTFGSPEAASALDQLPYKMAITYSKIVDPQSVAREGEVEAAKKYIVPLGMMANKKQALASIDSQEKEINRRAAEFAKVKNLKLEDLLVTPPSNSASASRSDAASSDEYVLVNGKLVKKTK